MKDIIVGVDRSETAWRAAEVAADLAVVYGTNLHVVMCVDRTKPIDISVGTDRFHADYVNRRVQGVGRVLGSVASDVAKSAPCDVLVANTGVAA